MLHLTNCDPAVLSVVERVTTEIVSLAPSIYSPHLMIVGAACRDVLQSALGHDFGLRATQDVDVGVALAEWSDYEDLTGKLRAIPGNSNGIRYDIAGLPVDLMPFGSVEDPAGTVTPSPRNQGMSVWAFREVYGGSLELSLQSGLAVRIPTIPGYAALKLGAWLDRAEFHEYKDASDIATSVFWYAESSDVEQRLYDTATGNAVLTEANYDLVVASAQLLGRDVADLIGPERSAELNVRWPDRREEDLIREMVLPVGVPWPHELERRREIVRGLERGLFSA